MVLPTKSRTAGPRTASTESGPALSREAVIDHALDLADREGLAAVSIRRIAQDFGVTPMALYWHVKNKDELLAAMGERIVDSVELPELASDGGLARLRPLLERLVGALARHPASTPLVQARILHCDAGRTLTEQALSILSDAGFDTQRRAELARAALQSVVMLVVGAPGAEIDVPEAERQAMRDRKQQMLAGLPADRYPLLIDSAVAMFDCDPETYYADGIDLYLAGVTALAARREHRPA